MAYTRLVMSGFAARLLTAMRGVLAVLLCALAAHVVAYRSFVPEDSIHGYFDVYGVIVSGLSAVALVVLGLLLAASLVGRPGPLRALVGRSSSRSPAGRVVALTAFALAAVFVQERLEHGLVASTGIDARTWVLAAAVVFLAAVLIVVFERSCEALIRKLIVGRRTLSRAYLSRAGKPLPPRSRRRRALADFCGLRAPPALSG